jgi:DNA gyrase inhibitor GyrI
MFAHTRSPVNWFGVIPSFRHFFKGDRAQYLAAVTIPDQLKGVKGVSNFTSPAGVCAKFEHVGPLNEQTINAAIYDWLPSSGYKLDHNKPILVDFGPINLLQYADQFADVNMQGLAYERLGFTADFLASSRVNIYIPLEMDAS